MGLELHPAPCSTTFSGQAVLAERPGAPLEPAAPARPAVGGGVFSCCRVPGCRGSEALTAAMPGTQCFLLLLPLLAMPAPSQAWSRPLWYQVGLDLQPWGCQPDSLEGCGTSLGCSSHWMGLGMNPIYPVAGFTLTTTMMLVISRKVLQRRRSQGTNSEQPKGTTDISRPHKQRTPISDHAILLTVLHMLDALLAQIQGHLQHLATQQPVQIKGTPAQSG